MWKQDRTSSKKLHHIQNGWSHQRAVRDHRPHEQTHQNTAAALRLSVHEETV